MKIGRIEINWLQKPKTYKQKIADNMNYINGKTDKNAASIRSLISENRVIAEKITNLEAFEIATKIEIKEIKETFKTITLVLDGMTKK